MTTKTPKGLTVGHADHGLTSEHLAVIDAAFEGETGFVLKVVTLPEGVPDLMSALYGPDGGDSPLSEDQVFYQVRNNRPGPSRLVARPHRPCRKMVVCGSASDGVVYTSYGTQADFPSPREWWDSSMKPHEAMQSAKFWSAHALAE